MIKDALENELENSIVRTYLLDFLDIRDNDTIIIELPCAKSIIDYLSKKSRRISFFNESGEKRLSDFDKADFIFSLEDPRFERNLDSGYFHFLFDHLENSGHLVLSVTNTLAYSYLCGESDTHTGSPFGGFSYGDKRDKNHTLTKKEIKGFLEKAGFKNIIFYYPMPDAVFPSEIYSDDFLPSEGDIRDEKRNYKETGMDLIKTESLVNKIISEGLFTDFANSFLIIAER